MQLRHPYYILLVAVLCFVLDKSSAQENGKESWLKPNHRIRKKETSFVKKKNHKQTEEMVKKLEYAAIHESTVSALEFGLVPVDLRLLPDNEFALDVVEGIDDELTMIDSELADQPVRVDKTTLPEHSDERSTSLIYQGMYIPSPGHNQMVDKVLKKVKRDMRKRLMDPLYFTVHERGSVRHSPQNENPIDFLHDRNRTRNAVGGGVIRGLLKLKRFGHSESIDEKDRILVRSHFFFGPLQISMDFIQPPRVRSINSTLASLAGHALFSVDKKDNTVTLLDFITDSPLEYEIRLRGSKHPRFQSLSRTAIQRMFRRNGRMETRFQRSFIRAVTPKKKNKGNANAAGTRRQPSRMPVSGGGETRGNFNQDAEVLDRIFERTTPSSTTQRRIFDDE